MAQKKTTAAAQPAAKKAGLELPLTRPAAKTAQPAAPESVAAQPVAAAKNVAPAPKVAEAKTPVTAPVAARRPTELVPVAAFQGVDELTAAGREAIETYVTCSTIAARGVETLGKEVVSFTQASVEAQFALAKTLMGAKTLQDAIEAQSDYTRESIDHMAAEAAKLTEMSVKLASQLMEPIQARVNATTVTILKPLAA